MHWKDTLYFTKSQQYGIFALLCLLIVLTAINAYLSFRTNPITPSDSSDFQQEVALFYQSLKDIPERKSYYADNKKYSEKQQHKITPFAFDPNTISESGLTKLGLSPFAIRNIIRYRSKGGTYRSKEHFSKTYGISAEDYQQLEAYVEITTKSSEKKYQTPPAVAKLLQIDLNKADTTELKKLKGIGSGFARRIVAYRNKLGGFYSPTQIKEVYGLSPELAESLMPQLVLDNPQLQKIDINKASVERLKSHPYFNFYQAKAIVEYRKKKGNYQSIDDFSKIESKDLSPEFIQKIGPYLSF